MLVTICRIHNTVCWLKNVKSTKIVIYEVWRVQQRLPTHRYIFALQPVHTRQQVSATFVVDTKNGDIFRQQRLSATSPQIRGWHFWQSTNHCKHYRGQPRPSEWHVLDRQSTVVCFDWLVADKCCQQISASVNRWLEVPRQCTVHIHILLTCWVSSAWHLAGSRFGRKLEIQLDLGRGLFLGGQPCPIPRAGPQYPQFWGHLYLPTWFDPEWPNSAW